MSSEQAWNHPYLKEQVQKLTLSGTKLNGGKQAHSSILFAAAPSIGVDMDIEMDGV